MPSASHLQDREGQPSATLPPTPFAQAELQLDLQTPSATLRQHLDVESLPRSDYFETLDELHLWYQMQYGDTLQDHLEPCSKHAGPPHASSRQKAERRPKLVVCHDFQGGYNESPHQRGYTLEHMHLVDTLIYFSHKRVSIPPVGWIASASRTGTKVLGTLIFEWVESIPEMARLLRGPERKAMPLRGEPCFSPQYAIELIELALNRGFSGYLVNVETALDLGFSCSGEAWPAWVGEQARIGEMQRNAERLRGWVHFLREQGARRFIEEGRQPDEWEVMWYDSVVYPHGQLAWQDALNEHNIPFFQSSHSFFTNYTWARPPQPLPPGQLIDPEDQSPQTLQRRGFGLTGASDGGYHPQLLLSAAMADSIDRARHDVYVGIDVFGRNCWGGLKAWKSLDMIGPHQRHSDGKEEALGLSVALFAPGWTWEEENAGLSLAPFQASQRRSWADWWHVDSAFWLGLSPSQTATTHRINLAEANVKPVQTYFSYSNLEPDRRHRRAKLHGFYTNFSFGSGMKWFDSGELVHVWSSEDKDHAGFTDMGASMPIPDAFFAGWHDDKQEKGLTMENVETLSWWFDQERVWAGTTSFVVALTACNDHDSPGSKEVKVPLCSAVIPVATGDDEQTTEWQYTIVYDGQEASATHLQPWVMLSHLNEDGTVYKCSHDAVKHAELGNGWKAATMRVPLYCLAGAGRSNRPVALILGFSAQANKDEQIRVRVGALQVSLVSATASSPASSLVVRPATDIFNVEGIDAQAKRLRASMLTWNAPNNSPPMMYYNVWIQRVDQPESRCWLGTSTREATPFEFCIPAHLSLPPHLAQADEKELEFVVTSLDIPTPSVVAKGPAILL